VTLCVLFLLSFNPTGLLFWFVIVPAAGIGLFIYGFRLLQRRRLILDTPFSKIRSASLGMVEVSGLAVGPYTMIAPVTEMPCYYYRTYVWELKKRDKNKEWVKVAAECMHVPFFLDDNTGRVLIDPRGADLDIHRDFHEEFCDSFFSLKDPAPPSVRSFLTRHGVETRNKVRVEEYCIKPKNALFVLGTLAENPNFELAPNPIQDVDGASLTSSHGITLSWSTSFGSTGTFNAGSLLQRLVPGSNTPEPEVIRLSTPAPAKAISSTQQERISAALVKAGISNPAAWAAAGLGQRAYGVSEDSSTATGGNGFDHHPPVALMKGSNDKTFLISWRSQQAIARSLGWKCVLMIWGGPVLILLSLYALLNLMHRM
jgi:hypothetical protein